MSWEDIIIKESRDNFDIQSNAEEIKEFIDLINLRMRMYEKSNNIKYLKVMKMIVEDEIKRRQE